MPPCGWGTLLSVTIWCPMMFVCFIVWAILRVITALGHFFSMYAYHLTGITYESMALHEESSAKYAYLNQKASDKWTDTALRNLQNDMINQHTVVRRDLQERHFSMEVNINTYTMCATNHILYETTNAIAAANQVTNDTPSPTPECTELLNLPSSTRRRLAEAEGKEEEGANEARLILPENYKTTTDVYLEVDTIEETLDIISEKLDNQSIPSPAPPSPTDGTPYPTSEGTLTSGTNVTLSPTQGDILDPSPSPNSGGTPFPTSFEGTYLYTNKCGLVFQATIGCGESTMFGDDDDLCLYSEFSAGLISNSTEDGAVPIVGTDAFFVPNPILDGSEVDKDTVCVFSGAFRKSSAFDYDDEGNILFLPLPLASSNGCQVTTKNFKLVVKGTVVSEGEDGREQIELDFSDDSGVSYYTDDKECPLSYVALKLDDNEGRSLTAVDKDEKSIILGHRALQSLSLCDTSGW